MLYGSGLIPAQLSWQIFCLLLPLLALVALLLDRIFAEPKRFHPLVAFGRWAAWLERRLNPEPGRATSSRRLRGCLAMLLALSPLLPVVLIIYLSAGSLWLWCVLNVLVLYSCIGWQSLQAHVGAVAEAGSIAAARERLAMIVSRETAELDHDEVAQAACESLLENSSDALFVSLFWFAVGAAPLALLHRWVNTLDAMWGYRNERYKTFGTCAARLDDILAYWPARLTALLFIAVAGRHCVNGWRCWRQQARACSSPNGGVVMTTGAGALNIRLSARACYHGQWKQKPAMGCGRPAQMADIHGAIWLVRKSLWLLLFIWFFSVAVVVLFAWYGVLFVA